MLLLDVEQIPDLSKDKSEPSDGVGSANRPFASRRALFIAGFVVIAGVTWLLSMVRLYLEPSLFEGTHMIEFQLPPGENTTTGEYEREFEILQSQDVLSSVVAKLRLDRKWDLTEAEATQKLTKSSSFEPLASFRMARIKVHLTEAALAAQLADGIADSYAKSRSAQRKMVAEKYIDTLGNQITLMQDRAEKERVALLDVIEHYKSTPIEGSPIVISNGKAIDPRMLGETEFADYLGARRQLIVAEEHTARYGRLRDTVETLERQRIDARIEMENRGAATITHERAVIPTAPALPDMEAEVADAGWRALAFGLVGGLLLVIFVPMLRRPSATFATTPSPR